MSHAKAHAAYAVADLTTLEPVRCPCGWARRAFGALPDALLSLHVVDVERDAQTHRHAHHTEVYFVLECEPGAKVELDGEAVEVRPGFAVYIPPGVRHRAAGRMKILNVVLPPFDEADEHFD
jgi:mannose-6-phosphate isomerase-like protein (cupin superfamily)